MTRKYLLWAGALALSVSAKAARADSVVFTLLNPTQTGTVGSVFTYQATVTAPSSNTGFEYLNGVSETVSGPVSVDDSDFGNNFPFSLSPGQSFTGDLFTITAGAGSAGTTSLGTILLQGGSTAGSLDTLGSANFSAQVPSAVAATPEPSSLMLLATGLAGGVAAVRRRLRISGGR